MPIKFRCQSCNKRLSITTRKAGKTVVCPACSTKIKVPELDPPAEEPVAEKPAKKKPVEKEVVPPPVETKAEIKPEAEKPPEESFSEQQSELEQDSEQEQQPEHKQESEYEQQADDEPESDYESEPPAPKTPIQLGTRCEEDNDQEYDFEMRRASTDFEELDMTPMVDVTFLLLIFFMVTASFSIQKALQVPPPDPDQQGAAQTVQPLEELEETSILIEIDAENRFMVESEPVNDVRDLASVLAEVRARESKNEVIVKVDEQTHHEAVVAAIDAAQEVGMQRIRWGISPD